MTTLSVMKARIASELRRGSTLTSQIASAITDAIEAYQIERFWFNESRDLTFSTVANTGDYTSSTVSGLANIEKIDYVFMYEGNTENELFAIDPAELESSLTNGTSTGTPGEYCWYNNTFRLYPVPSAVWTIRIGHHKLMAAPASDSEASNVWMTYAERLIRCRAKYEMALHVLRDQALAELMVAGIEDALATLRRRTSRLTRTGSRVSAMPF